MLRRVAALVILADTVAGFQGSWFSPSPLRTPAAVVCASSRPVAPRFGLRGVRSQMGFNAGDEASKSSDSSTGAQSGGGMPGDMPGGMPGMPPGMEQLFSDPEIAAAMNNPKVMKAMEEMRTGGPAAMAKYASDPEFMTLIGNVQAKMASVAGGMPNMPPGMAGFNTGGMPKMPPGMDQVLGDPEIMKALQNPKMMKVMMEMMQGGPAAMKKYESDPEFADLLARIQAKLGAPGSAPAKNDAPTKNDAKSSGRLDWEASKFRTTNPNAGGFGFEAVLNQDSPPAKSPQEKINDSTPAGGIDEQQKEAFERLMKRQAGNGASASDGMIGFETGAPSAGTADGANSLSLKESLKARIADANKKTEKIIDQQQKEAFERLKKRQAEEAAAKQRYLDNEKKYQEVAKLSRNMAARDREQFVKDAVKLDPDMAAYKERVDLMQNTERQWGEIKEMLRTLQVGSGIELLNPLTGEPGPAAYVLIGLTLCLPLVLGVQFFSSIFAFLQALRGAPDPLDSYDPGAYLPPM